MQSQIDSLQKLEKFNVYGAIWNQIAIVAKACRHVIITQCLLIDIYEMAWPEAKTWRQTTILTDVTLG